jgi:hypothetical protein
MSETRAMYLSFKEEKTKEGSTEFNVKTYNEQ